MKEVRRIEFTGKNLNDVFQLPCVKSIEKLEDQPILTLYPDKVFQCTTARPGDTLVEYENKIWCVL